MLLECACQVLLRKTLRAETRIDTWRMSAEAREPTAEHIFQVDLFQGKQLEKTQAKGLLIHLPLPLTPASLCLLALSSLAKRSAKSHPLPLPPEKQEGKV